MINQPPYLIGGQDPDKNSQQPVKVDPKRKVNNAVIISAIVGFLILTLCCVGIIVQGSGDGDARPAIEVTTASTFSSSIPTTVPVTPSAVKVIKASDFTLKVKIISKQCFGSAGCNVRYKIQAGWDDSIFRDIDECDVTYSVSGLEDSQMNTLTARKDGKYEADSEEFGSTSSSLKKLTAKATEIECS